MILFQPLLSKLEFKEFCFQNFIVFDFNLSLSKSKFHKIDSKLIN